MNKLNHPENTSGCSLTKKELALKYHPNMSPENATRILRRWISQDIQLLSELVKVNYRKNNHLLTPNQVRVIYKFLGIP